MQRILFFTLIVVNTINLAHSATKIVAKRENDKTISISTTTIHRDYFDAAMKRIREPAPPNACPRVAFEILNPRDNEPRCVNLR